MFHKEEQQHHRGQHVRPLQELTQVPTVLEDQHYFRSVPHGVSFDPLELREEDRS